MERPTYLDSIPGWAIRLIQLAAILIAAVIIWQSLRPSNGGLTTDHVDKVMHFLSYACLAGAMRLGWRNIWGGYLLIFCTVMGSGLEIAQGMMGIGRTASIADAIANFLGAAFVLFVLRRFRT